MHPYNFSPLMVARPHIYKRTFLCHLSKVVKVFPFSTTIRPSNYTVPPHHVFCARTRASISWCDVHRVTCHISYICIPVVLIVIARSRVLSLLREATLYTKMYTWMGKRERSSCQLWWFIHPVMYKREESNGW